MTKCKPFKRREKVYKRNCPELKIGKNDSDSNQGVKLRKDETKSLRDLILDAAKENQKYRNVEEK